MFGVGLIGSVDFILEELVEESEVFGDFVGDVGGDILEGQGEPGVVALVGVEGENSGGGGVLLSRDTVPMSGLLVLSVQQSPGEAGNKQWAMVGDDVVWESMLGEDMFEESFGELQSIVSGVAGDEEGLLGEVADNKEDCIKALGVREFDNVVHQD
ncbi:hypothetical protein C0989_012080 [Termitomyces sp. Mn162]|nr:hypothetical protein C0989_012080 [Termitomyces sp. Mn162]